MKILQVMAGARHGGAEEAFMDFTLAFAEAGVVMEVVTRPHPTRVARLREAGLIVHELPFGGFADVYTGYRIGRICRTFQPDIILSWMSRAAQKTPRWRKSMCIPRYVHVSRLGGYYDLKYYKSSEYFVANTPDIARYIREEGGVEAARVRYIPNFAPEDAGAKGLDRAAMGVPDGAPLVLALGRLHENKGFDVLIRAVADVPGAHLWIAGEGPLRAALEAFIANLNVADRVSLLGWRDDRSDLLKTADICVISSRAEPFGNVFVQAWSHKIPLITTACEGPVQFVRDGEDALVVPVDDVMGLAAAIQKMMKDDQLSEKLKENGFKRFQTDFTKDRAVAGYLTYFGKILSKIPSPSPPSRGQAWESGKSAIQ